MLLTVARIASLISASAFVIGITLTPAAAETLKPVSPPVPMPAFKLPGLNGEGSDADLRNKVTIIRFWATW